MTAQRDLPGRVLPRQLVLDLTRDPSFEGDQFLEAACNSEALQAIMRWPHWPDQVLLLVGPAGSGKSHLASLFAERSGGSFVVQRSQAAFEDALGRTALVLEDADRIGLDEHTFFHLLNHVRTEGSWLLVTARQPPSCWDIGTPDLLSRLRAAPVATLHEADDATRKAIMIKLFHDRQIPVDAQVIDFVAKRIERSLDSVRDFVDRADREALAHGKKVSRALAVAILERCSEDREGSTDYGPT